MSISDDVLIERIIKKDEGALFFFYKKYRPFVLRFIEKKIRQVQDAEDITEEVFYDFIEGVRYFRKDSSCKTYLYSIAKHKTVDFLRKKKLKQILFSTLPDYVVNGLGVVLGDEEIERKELASRIAKTISLLPNDYQVILRLKYIEGEKVAHIAEKIMLSFKATESMLFRARRAFIQLFINT